MRPNSKKIIPISIQNLSSNESKVETDSRIKTKQVDKNIRIIKIVNSLKAIKPLKQQTQK